VRTFEYFGGVPAALVPDQLKSGVTRACRYEPDVQRTYEELAQHYGDDGDACATDAPTATKGRWKWRCRSRNDGYSRAFATKCSTR